MCGTTRRSYGAGFCLMGLGFLSVSGCQPQALQGIRALKRHPIAKIPTDPDIVEVKKFFSMNPWLSFDSTRTPGGFKVTVYLISAKTQRGAFGEGIIHVIMSLVEKDENGKAVLSEIRRWSYDPEQALPYRAKKKQLLGYGYQFRCNWEDADVLGKEVSIRIEFERKDGRVITSQPASFIPPVV